MYGSSKLPGSSGALPFVSKLLRAQPDCFSDQKRISPGFVGINNSGDRMPAKLKPAANSANRSMQRSIS